MLDQIEVRFTDVDSDGHVGHIPVIEWVAHSRVKFIDKKIKNAKLWKTIDYVLVNIKINFLKEIFYPGLISVKVKSLKIGTKSITTKYQVFNAEIDDILAEANCVNVFINYKTRTPINIPNELREVLTIE